MSEQATKRSAAAETLRVERLGDGGSGAGRFGQGRKRVAVGGARRG
jgi:hypothetical protein